MTVEEEMDYHVEYASKMLREQGMLTPMFVVDCDLGRVPIMLEFRDREEKAAKYAFIKLFCLAHDATQIIAMLESWVTILDREGKVAEKGEALNVTIIRRDATRHVMRTIVRDDKGEIADLRPESDDKLHVTVENAVERLLPKEPVPAYQRDGALNVLRMMGMAVDLPETRH